MRFCKVLVSDRTGDQTVLHIISGINDGLRSIAAYFKIPLNEKLLAHRELILLAIKRLELESARRYRLCRILLRSQFHVAMITLFM